MAAAPAYDYLIKLLVIGDSGVGKTVRVASSCDILMVPSQQILLAPLAYYRGAMGILLVYDVTDESSFNNIRNWIRNIERNAPDTVNKILIGNKADMEGRAVPRAKGQALADEYGIKFFETSARMNVNVEEAFFSIARDIKQRLADSDTRQQAQGPNTIGHVDQQAGNSAPANSSCCGS